MSDAATLALAVDPRAAVRLAPMSGAQQAAVAVTVALSALDGYDVLAATLAGPGLVRAWGMNHAALGAVLSSGLVGMAAGSLLLAPLADLWGRRTLIFVCLALMAVGMEASGLSGSMVELSAWRFVTGLGIGAMIPVINPLATEFASERRRDLAVSLMAVGYPIGGVVGGGVATLLLARFDWPVLFHLGAILALVMIPVVFVWLPEPLSFLVERRRPDALERVNRLLARFDHAAIPALPPALSIRTAPIGAVLGRDGVAATLRITMLNLCYVAAVYYMLSWTPQLVADFGFSPSEAASVALLVSVAGIAGGIAFGWAAATVGAKRLTIAVFVAFAVSIIGFSYAPGHLGILRAAGAVLGFFLFAGMCALHAVVSRSFHDRDRATGAGIVLGVGRAASAIAPAAAGLLFSLGVGRTGVSLAMAAGVLVAAALLIGHRAAAEDIEHRQINNLRRGGHS